jgi:hypothetical protein
MRSVSVWKMSTHVGVAADERGFGAVIDGCGLCESGAAPPPRLWIRKPSKTCVVGWTAFT